MGLQGGTGYRPADKLVWAERLKRQRKKVPQVSKYYLLEYSKYLSLKRTAVGLQNCKGFIISLISQFSQLKQFITMFTDSGITQYFSCLEIIQSVVHKAHRDLLLYGAINTIQKCLALARFLQLQQEVLTPPTKGAVCIRTYCQELELQFSAVQAPDPRENQRGRSRWSQSQTSQYFLHPTSWSCWIAWTWGRFSGH